MRRHVVLLVLGNVQQSPRMRAHAHAWAAHGCQVTLIGYGEGRTPVDGDDDARRASPRFLSLGPAPSSVHARSRARRWHYALAMLWSVLSRLAILLWTLCVRLERWDVLIAQNPPAIPTIFCAYIGWWLRGRRRSRWLVDWHNSTSSILQVQRAPTRLVAIARTLELAGSRWLAHGHLCVSRALKAYLVAQARLSPERITVVYDRPRQAMAEEALRARQMSREAFVQALRARLPSRAFELDAAAPWLITSTSWTPDENMHCLLDALCVLEREHGWAGEVIITGRGPMRDAFVQQQWPARGLQRIRLHALWLPSWRDYVQVLAHADVGISLHASSSGLDLPMKVVDMLACGLPVAALSYFCIANEMPFPQLRTSGEVDRSAPAGVLFSDANELALAALYVWRHRAAMRQAVAELVAGDASWRWETHWADTLLPFCRRLGCGPEERKGE